MTPIKKAAQRPSHEYLHRGWEQLQRNWTAPYASLIEEWHRDGSHGIQLGLEPDRDDLPRSLWFVHGRGGRGGLVKLARFLEGNVAGLTPVSLQKMWHDRFDIKLCLDDYLYTVDGDVRRGCLPDPAGTTPCRMTRGT